MNTRTKTILTVCLFFALCLGAFLLLKPYLPTAGYHKLTPEEARDMLAQGDVTLLDVRTTPEYTQRHIEGAILIPHIDIEAARPEAQLPDLDATILVYCRTGARSYIASKLLLQYGYNNVYDMGGINDWPYETLSGAPEG